MRSRIHIPAKRKLTDATVAALQADSKSYKIGAGGGLYVFVSAAGARIWRMNYSYGENKSRKQKTLVLGHHPDMSVDAAKAALKAAKVHLQAGRDPARVTPETDGSALFRDVAERWMGSKTRWADKYRRLIRARMEADIFPVIGKMPIAAVRKVDVQAALNAVALPPPDGRGAIETAHRLREYVRNVFRYSIDDRVTEATADVPLPDKPKVRHFKRLPQNRLGAFLVALEHADAEPLTKLAIKLTMLTAARTTEILDARWSEFTHLKRPGQAMWKVAPDRMKKGLEHYVPLSTQAVAVLLEIQKITAGEIYLFPAADGKAGRMSANTMLFATYAMGFRNKTTIHGFRASFKTIATNYGWDDKTTELCLAHVEGSSTKRAYNDATLLPERRKCLQWWGDLLDAEKARAEQNERLFA